MAAAIKAINARIRANPTLDYFCSTHFWGPASNFGIPIAAVMDTQKDPEIISGRFTGTLCVYSAVFMRYALAVTPKNYLLFGCHFINFGAQTMQGYRYTNYWYMGGREKALTAKAVEGGSLSAAGKRIEIGAEQAQGAIKEYATKAEYSAKNLAETAKKQAEKLSR